MNAPVFAVSRKPGLTRPSTFNALLHEAQCWNQGPKKSEKAIIAPLKHWRGLLKNSIMVSSQIPPSGKG